MRKYFLVMPRVAIWLSVGLIIVLSFLWFWPLRGLMATYYENQEWRGDPTWTLCERTFALERVSAAQETFPQRYFSVSWNGWLRIDREGEYGFATDSDDGSSVVIDGVTVVDNGGVHVGRKVSGTIHLTKGLHAFQVNYFQAGGAYQLQVFWQPPQRSETALAPQYLYPQPFPVRGMGLLMRYWVILYLLAWSALLGSGILRRIQQKGGNLPLVAREYGLNLLIVVLSVLVFGVLAEISMRVSLAFRERQNDLKLLLQASKETDFEGGPQTYSLKGIVQASAHDDIVYELKPNLKGNFLGVPLVTNSRGLRDVEYSYRKPANTVRIVGLGDSSMFGWGVRSEDTSLKVLETLLNQAGSPPRYEVLNFAAPGYNTAMEVEVFLKKCVKYEPDMVIMHFNTNDYDVPGLMKPPQSATTLRKSYFLRFLLERLEELWGRQQAEMLPFIVDRTMGLEESENLDRDPVFPDEYRHLVGKSGFLRALDKLLAATAEKNIPVIVYVVKAYPGLDPEYAPNPFRDRQLQLITQLSQEKGFLLVNMYAPYMRYLREHPEADEKVFWVTDEDSHPSAIAHHVEAQTLYEALVTAGLASGQKSAVK